jgi:predicted nuclease of restriction endonuclease-like (RecB) superfamily
MSLIRKNNFEELVNSIYQTHCVLQENAIRNINLNLTIRNWLIGHYIVEYEQDGQDRAKYGDNLIGELAEKLKAKGLKGFSVSAMKNHRTFYLYYPQISQTVIGLLQSVDFQNNLLPPTTFSEKSQTVSGFLEVTAEKNIWLTASAKSEDNMNLSSELLLSRLSYSHFIELIRIEDELQRFFYEVEAIKNNWSIRELKRAIGTSLAFRTAMSTNKEAIIAKIKNLKPATNAEIIRNPYVMEFMGFDEKSEYSETDLEQQILNHLQEFLIELGTGFCFEARQKRITFNNKHYRIDLVFYHKILKCNVLFDLKINEFDYSDAGQMNMYLNYYKDNEMAEGDNPPVGIILCPEKDGMLVKYSTAGMDDQLFVSKYLVKLPEKKVFENFLKRELNR